MLGSLIPATDLRSLLVVVSKDNSGSAIGDHICKDIMWLNQALIEQANCDDSFFYRFVGHRGGRFEVFHLLLAHRIVIPITSPSIR